MYQTQRGGIDGTERKQGADGMGETDRLDIMNRMGDLMASPMPPPRSCLDAVSMSRFLQFIVIWGADVASFGAQNVSYGMLAAFTLASWGTIERSRGTSENKN